MIDPQSPNVLIVESQPELRKILKYLLNRMPGLKATFCQDIAEVKQYTDCFIGQYKAMLVEQEQWQQAQVADCGIPAIVFVEQESEQQRQQLLQQGAVEVIAKEGLQSYQFALGLLHRLANNCIYRVLVVDDSATVRRMMVNLLERYRYRVCQAEDGVEAIARLQQFDDISLVISDYQMPNMDGIALVQQLRRDYDEDALCFIGLSSATDPLLSSKFIKNGANDFLHKPFVNDELYCRVNHNIERIERIHTIRDLAEKDALTGLFNRRYFFDKGDALYQHHLTQQLPLAVAVIDVDHFKKVNDTHGHNVGDEVLKALAAMLKQGLERFLLARTGGEEFYVVMAGIDAEQGEQVIDILRGKWCSTAIATSAGELNVSFSAGVCDASQPTLTDALAEADRMLYDAKSLGRNQVVRSGALNLV